MNPDAEKLWRAPQWAFAVLLALSRNATRAPCRADLLPETSAQGMRLVRTGPLSSRRSRDVTA